MSAISTAVIPSSTNQRLACLAERFHAAGPDLLLQLMKAQLTSSDDTMAVFERFGAATLPAPSRLEPAQIIFASSRFKAVR